MTMLQPQQDEMITLMARAPLFQGLDEEALRHILAGANARRAAKEEFLFMQEDEAHAVILVLQGTIKLTQVTEDGHQVVMEMVSRGDCIGIVAVLSEMTYPVAAQALMDVKYLSWDRNLVNQLIEEYPQIARNAIRILAGYIQSFQDRIRELSTQRVEQRIARALLRLVRQCGKKTRDGVLIDLPVTRQDLAELTGTTMFTVSRVLKKWEGMGLIRSSRQRIEILFPHGLATIAEDLSGD